MVSCIKIVLIDFAYKRFNCLLSLLLPLLLFFIILLLVLLIVDIISLLLLNVSRVNGAQIREESTLLETARGRYRQGLLGTGIRAGDPEIRCPKTNNCNGEDSVVSLSVHLNRAVST